MNQPCSNLYGYTFETAWYKEKYTAGPVLLVLQLLVCASISWVLLYFHASVSLLCAAYTLASSLVAYVTFTTAVSVSVFTAKQDRKRRTWKKRKEKKNTQKMTHSKQRFGHMHIAVLCCCRRWVRDAFRFPWWPREPLACVNLLQPSPHWLPSRPCCFLYRQEQLNTIASLPLAQ